MLTGLKLYFAAFPHHSVPRGGGHLFRLAAWLHERSGGPGQLRLNVGGYDAVIDIRDGRFIGAVTELLDEDIHGLMSSFLAEGDTFIDVGANQGTFSIIGSHLVGASGTVIAVEPQPSLAAIVRQSLAISPVNRYDVLNVALGQEEGEVRFFVPKHDSGTAGIHETWSGQDEADFYTVPMRRFDEVAAWTTYTGDTFIKLDCEGSELLFLKGAEQMIRGLRPVIYMEINPKAMAAAGIAMSSLRAELARLGYTTYCEPTSIDSEHPLSALHTEHQYDILLRPTRPAERP